MANKSPAQFLREVRQETAKVTWPSRKEVRMTTIMVFIMVVIASVFLTSADMVFRLGLQWLVTLVK